MPEWSSKSECCCKLHSTREGRAASANAAVFYAVTDCSALWQQQLSLCFALSLDMIMRPTRLSCRVPALTTSAPSLPFFILHTTLQALRSQFFSVLILCSDLSFKLNMEATNSVATEHMTCLAGQD